MAGGQQRDRHVSAKIGKRDEDRRGRLYDKERNDDDGD
jgi:hypothetical protein